MRFTSPLGKTAVLLFALGQPACAIRSSLPKLQSDRPIEIHHGFLGASYRQNGQVIDPSDMQDQLQRDPHAASDMSSAKTFAVVAMAFGAIGGALIGWPVGQAIGGEAHPIWPLAYAGGGAIALSIPFAVWADSSLNSAVEAFNQHLPRPASEPSPGAQ
jgi:hypothetical protein